MDLQQVECFLAVAEELHFGKAADKLHLSATTVSASVRRLEHELGGALFVRTTRKVELTALGSMFALDARKAYDAVTDAYRRARKQASSIVTTVLVGYSHDSERHSVFRLLPEFRELHPGALLDFRRFPTGALIEMLSRGDIDLCICYAPELDASIDSATLGWAPLVALVPDDHRYAERRCITLAELAKEPLVLFHREVNPGCYGLVETALNSTGVSWTVTSEGPDIENLSVRALAGLGVAVGLGAAVESIPLAGLHALAIEDGPVAPKVLAWRRDSLPAVLDLVELIRTNQVDEDAA